MTSLDQGEGMMNSHRWRSWQVWLVLLLGLGIGLAVFVLVRHTYLRTATIKIENNRRPNQMTVDYDDQLLAVSDLTGVTIFALPSYSQTADLDVQIYENRIPWNSDLSQFATIDSHYTSVEVWDVSTQTKLHRLASDAQGKIPLSSTSSTIGPEYVTGLAWHPDGKTIAIARVSGRRELWNLETDTVTTVPQEGNDGERNCFRWSVDGQQLLMDTDDGIQAYEWPSLKPLALSEWVYCGTLAFNQTGDLLAASDIGETKIFEYPALDLLGIRRAGDFWGKSIAWHPTKPMLAIADNRAIQLWSVPDQTSVDIPVPDYARVTSLAFSLDGQALIVGLDDPDYPGAIHEWPLQEIAPEFFK